MSLIAALPSHASAFVTLFLQGYPPYDPGHHHGLFLAPFFLLLGLIFSVVMLIPYWFIFKKAGFSPWLAILVLVPLVNIILLYAIAFAEWRVVPVTRYPAPPTGTVYPPTGGIYPPAA
jgi:hypothetical protein